MFAAAQARNDESGRRGATAPGPGQPIRAARAGLATGTRQLADEGKRRIIPFFNIRTFNYGAAATGWRRRHLPFQGVDSLLGPGGRRSIVAAKVLPRPAFAAYSRDRPTGPANGNSISEED